MGLRWLLAAAFAAAASAQDHFYTTDLTEADAAVRSGGYRWEGTAGKLLRSQSPGSQPLLRLFNPTTGDHFYTLNAQEAATATATGGYRSEGVAGFCYPGLGHPNTTPLYRLFNPTSGDHFYTVSQAEAQSAAANAGYRQEGVTCNVVADVPNVPTPFYRLRNAANGLHFWTANLQERNSLIASGGWVSEGVAGYLFTAQIPGTSPLFRVLLPNGSHLFTILAVERDVAISSRGGRDEGVAGYVFSNGCSFQQRQPFFRLLSRAPNFSGEYFYTSNNQEYLGLIASGGWENENTECWLAAQPNATPFYRLFNPTA